MEKCSHEGHKLGEAMGHLKKMHREHGTPAAAGSKPENENRPNRKMERNETCAMKKDG